MLASVLDNNRFLRGFGSDLGGLRTSEEHIPTRVVEKPLRPCDSQISVPSLIPKLNRVMICHTEMYKQYND